MTAEWANAAMAAAAIVVTISLALQGVILKFAIEIYQRMTRVETMVEQHGKHQEQIQVRLDRVEDQAQACTCGRRS